MPTFRTVQITDPIHQLQVNLSEAKKAYEYELRHGNPGSTGRMLRFIKEAKAALVAAQGVPALLTEFVRARVIIGADGLAEIVRLP